MGDYEHIGQAAVAGWNWVRVLVFICLGLMAMLILACGLSGYLLLS